MLLTTCSYIPLEIPLALGIPARRLLPKNAGQEADSYLPRDFCPYARGVLSQVWAEKVSQALLGVAVAGSCDAMRRVYDGLRHYAPDIPSFYLDVPRTQDEDAVSYYAGVLRSFAHDLAAAYPSAPPEREWPERLWRAAQEIDFLRHALLTAYPTPEAVQGSAGSGKKPLGVCASVTEWVELYFALNEALALPDSGPPDWLRAAQAVRRSTSSPAAPRAPVVLLIGSFLLDATIPAALEANGLGIAAVDSCLGWRSLKVTLSQIEGDIFLRLAAAYLRKPPCPRLLVRQARRSWLEELLFEDGRKEAGVSGVIYFVPKFCDHGYYESVDVKDWLSEYGLPFLLLEGEYGAGLSAQMHTRLAAFRELLEERQGQQGAARAKEGRRT
ncbi:MAG: hypothetical protein PWQ41_521 [Bacillota bacterium]|nr:hypothetical protein [Bacillota bacterium]MDK2924747.1 hypothetical protein [Bacillota bacterium]